MVSPHTHTQNSHTLASSCHQDSFATKVVAHTHTITMMGVLERSAASVGAWQHARCVGVISLNSWAWLRPAREIQRSAMASTSMTSRTSSRSVAGNPWLESSALCEFSLGDPNTALTIAKTHGVFVKLQQV